VQLDQFSSVASKEVGRALKELFEQGAESIVLDLRNNPGGLLSEARRVADLFLPKNLRVVTTQSRLEDPVHLDTRTRAKVPAEVPVTVLINRFSASASEIVAGALQDHGRATLVGDRSFGKGSVQNLIAVGQDDDFRDENRNRVHDNWEELTRDLNENGEFDYAPRAKLTVAQYLLPSGRSIHRMLDDEGNIESLGGVNPEFRVAPKRWDAWRLEAFFELRDEGVVREWVLENWAEHQELFMQLAFSDDKETGRYPNFEEFYGELDTALPPEDVRFLVRSELRRKAQDVRGSEFPRGDFEEDLQLQKAIEIVMEESGKSYHDIPSYSATFELEESLTSGAIASTDHQRRPNFDEDMVFALGLIDEATRDDGRLSEEGLERLKEILSRLNDGH